MSILYLYRVELLLPLGNGEVGREAEELTPAPEPADGTQPALYPTVLFYLSDELTDNITPQL